MVPVCPAFPGLGRNLSSTSGTSSLLDSDSDDDDGSARGNRSFSLGGMGGMISPGAPLVAAAPARMPSISTISSDLASPPARMHRQLTGPDSNSAPVAAVLSPFAAQVAPSAPAVHPDHGYPAVHPGHGYPVSMMANAANIGSTVSPPAMMQRQLTDHQHDKQQQAVVDLAGAATGPMKGAVVHPGHGYPTSALSAASRAPAMGTKTQDDSGSMPPPPARVLRQLTGPEHNEQAVPGMLLLAAQHGTAVHPDHGYPSLHADHGYPAGVTGAPASAMMPPPPARVVRQETDNERGQDVTMSAAVSVHPDHGYPTVHTGHGYPAGLVGTNDVTPPVLPAVCRQLTDNEPMHAVMNAPSAGTAETMHKNAVVHPDHGYPSGVVGTPQPAASAAPAGPPRFHRQSTYN